ncbi:hypothetical protein GOB57_03940 [Sinorhizobium meliloti]|nr:hypothetical protein [Sinorhizobium meliloti]
MEGGDGNDTIYGGAGNDYMIGGYGNDLLFGDGGNDRLTGGDGADRLIGGSGADELDGGAGSDTASYERATSGVVVNLSKQDLNSGEARGDVLTSIENLQGSAHADLLYGSGSANRLFGGSGNDTLSSGNGNDTIVGGEGNDILTGGAGLDNFAFDVRSYSSNRDRVTDFIVSDDTIWLDDVIFTKVGSAGALSSSAFRKSATGEAYDSTDRVIYETDTGKLFYDHDGNGSAKAAHFATLSAGLSISAADFFIV